MPELAGNGNGRRGALLRSVLIASIPLMPTVLALVVYMSRVDSEVRHNTTRLDAIDSGGSRLLQLLDLRLRTVEANYDRRVTALELSVNMMQSRLAIMEERQTNMMTYIRELADREHADAESVKRLEDAAFGVFQNKIAPQRQR